MTCYGNIWAGRTAAGPLMAKRLREIAAPFVVPGPAGARVRARLRLDQHDAEVLTALGGYLGSLAGADLARRCGQGRLDARQRAASRRVRKQALTAGSSSRWAGAITRSSEDAWQLAARNRAAERTSLKARITAISTRLAVPAGRKQGRARGYGTQAERFDKQRRLQVLRHRLTVAERQAETGQVSVCRGGRRLAPVGTTSTPPGSACPSGATGGGRRGCSCVPTARRTRPGATRRSAGTPNSAGSRSSSPPP